MDLLTSRKKHPGNTEIKLGSHLIGDGSLTIIGGPCSIESRDQIIKIAESVKESGADILRGGAYKPRTSPYSFQGLGNDGLEFLSQAKEKTGLPIISEIMDIEELPFFYNVDIIQIGAKNMQNFPLLKKLGKVDKPILLKRGSGNTIEELLLSAEYLLNEGNEKIILCERGIRTFESATRYTFDINAIPLLKEKTHLPVFADPSHGTGISSIVPRVALAAVAAGADGLLIEVHDDPENALCDGPQATTLNAFSRLVTGARKYEEIRSIYK